MSCLISCRDSNVKQQRPEGSVMTEIIRKKARVMIRFKLEKQSITLEIAKWKSTQLNPKARYRTRIVKEVTVRIEK